METHHSKDRQNAILAKEKLLFKAERDKNKKFMTQNELATWEHKVMISGGTAIEGIDRVTGSLSREHLSSINVEHNEEKRKEIPDIKGYTLSRRPTTSR